MLAEQHEAVNLNLTERVTPQGTDSVALLFDALTRELKQRTELCVAVQLQYVRVVVQGRDGLALDTLRIVRCKGRAKFHVFELQEAPAVRVARADP